MNCFKFSSESNHWIGSVATLLFALQASELFKSVSIIICFIDQSEKPSNLYLFRFRILLIIFIILSLFKELDREISNELLEMILNLFYLVFQQQLRFQQQQDKINLIHF